MSLSEVFLVDATLDANFEKEDRVIRLAFTFAEVRMLLGNDPIPASVPDPITFPEDRFIRIGCSHDFGW